MKLTNQELYTEFYKEISSAFPGLTRSEIDLICNSPFKHLKNMMEGDEICEMRLKYFGSFLVYPRKAKYELEILDTRLEKNIISQTQYVKYKEMLENYLKKL